MPISIKGMAINYSKDNIFTGQEGNRTKFNQPSFGHTQKTEAPRRCYNKKGKILRGTSKQSKTKSCNLVHVMIHQTWVKLFKYITAYLKLAWQANKKMNIVLFHPWTRQILQRLSDRLVWIEFQILQTKLYKFWSLGGTVISYFTFLLIQYLQRYLYY